MRRLSIFLLIGIVAMLAAPLEASVATTTAATKTGLVCECDLGQGCTTTLYAGQTIEVGTVIAEMVDGNIVVTYDTTGSGWVMTETHLYVGCDEPKKFAPGQFPFKHEGIFTQNDVYTIDPDELECDPNDCGFVFATHAVVAYATYLDDFAMTLPDQVTMSVTYPYPGAPSYFRTTVSDSVLTGEYDGWCIDTTNVIYQNTDYTADVFSSFEDLPAGTVEHPENLDLVNWILNQGYVGQPSPGCAGTYTYGDVQRAIWTLVDPNSTSGLGSWSQCRVDEILAAANANGEGFVPDCGDVIAVILVPIDGQQVTIAQVTLIEVGIEECVLEYEETAWGSGPCAFPKKWGWFFSCILMN